MLMFGSDASTCAATSRGVSRNNEVTATPSRRDITGLASALRSWGRVKDQSGSFPHSNEVPSTQMQCRITASFRATAA